MEIYAKTRSRLATVVVRRDTKAGIAFDYVVQALVLTACAGRPDRRALLERIPTHGKIIIGL